MPARRHAPDRSSRALTSLRQPDPPRDSVYHEAFGALADAVVVLRAVRDADGAISDERIEFANEAWCRSVAGPDGIVADEGAVIGRGFLEVQPAQRTQFELHCRVIETGEPHRATTVRDDTGRWYDAQYVKSGDGVIVVARDVTELRQVEAALSESEERWRYALEGAGDGLWDWDVIAGTVWVSRRWKEMLGFAQTDPVGSYEDWSSRLHPDDTEATLELLEAHLSGAASPYLARYRLRHDDGHWVWILDRGMVLRRAPDGTPLRMIGTHTDISEPMKVAAAMRAGEERYRSLVEGVPGIMYTFSSTRGGLYYSPRTVDLLGYSPGELLAQPMLWHDSIHPDDLPRIDRSIANVEREGSSTVEYRIHDAHGAWRWFEDRSTHHVEDGGEVVIEGFALDITARKTAEQEQERLQTQLDQARKMELIGRLAGGVAHDFNNMLGAIMGHADLALDAVGPGSPVREDLEEIRSAARRSADLTRQLLAFARQQAVAPRVLDLNELIAGTLGMLRRLIGEDIRLIWRPAADLGLVRVDASQLDQVLANLCVNARDAIAGPGRITIETANTVVDQLAGQEAHGLRSGAYAEIRVTDNGSGMDPETAARVFEPFFTTKEVGRGTGLGLATVHGVIEQSGGRISVSSTPGVGTTFRIHLPVDSGLETPSMADDGTVPGGGREVILIVEDEPMILRLAATLLKRLGYRVLTANSPLAALRLADEHGPEIDLALVDVVMPEMNGHDLVSAIAERHPRIRYLYTSGYTADVLARHGVPSEGVHFLQKPYTSSVLDAAVRGVLDSA